MPEFHSIINPVDVTGPLADVISFILYIFKFCFDFLKSFEFAGTNLLNVSLSFALIAMALPIVVTLVRTGSTYSVREARAEAEAKLKSDIKKNDQGNKKESK